MADDDEILEEDVRNDDDVSEDINEAVAIQDQKELIVNFMNHH